MHNFYRFLFFAFFLFLSTSSLAQTITIGAVDPGPYGNGSSISVPITVSGCFQIGNKFELYLSDASGSFTNEKLIGSYNGFYTTFVNGFIPNGQPAGINYKLRVKSTLPPVVTSSESSVFKVIINPGVDAKIISDSPIKPSLPDVFGFCEGYDGAIVNFDNASTSEANVTLRFTNELNNSTHNVSFITSSVVFEPELAHYTIFVRAEKNGVIGSKSYFLINNKNKTPFTTLGDNTVCLSPDDNSGVLQFAVDYTSINGIQNNFPGNIYNLKWGDNGSVTESYTFCDIKSKSGFVTHKYLNSSCGNSAGGDLNVFGIEIKVQNPFCGDVGTAVRTTAKVLLMPKNDFDNPGVGCQNALISFRNTSYLGEKANSGTLGCTLNTLKYDWYVNNVRIAADKSVMDVFSYTFTTVGTHKVKLVSKGPVDCPAAPIEKDICIEPAPVPDFTIKTSGCAPLGLNVENKTNPSPCRENTYAWRVLDKTGSFQITSGVTINDAKAKKPSISVSIPGEYQLELKVTNSCGNFIKQVPFIVLDIVNVTLPITKSYCENVPKTIDFGTDANHKPIYQSGFSATQSYKWVVTGGNFSFENSTNDQSQYPIIKFLENKNYLVKVTYTNDCGSRDATQVIRIYEPVTVNAGPDQGVCVGTAVQLNGIVGGPQKSITWTGGTGTFSPGRNAANPTYTPAVSETGTIVILTLVVENLNPSPCGNITDPISITISPQNTITSAASKSICTETRVAYNPTASVSGSTFDWTAVVESGSVTGVALSGSGPINDLLINSSATVNAIVKYTITPKTATCTGVPFDVRITVMPKPAVTATPTNATICSGENTVINLSSNLANTSYTWTATSSGTVTGFSAQSSGVSTFAPQMLTNTGTVPGTVTYVITPLGISPLNCGGASQTVIITVNPKPSVANAGSDQVLCSDATTTTLTANNPSVGSGTWTMVSGTGANIVSPNANNTLINNLSPGEYIFRWTISSPSCSSTSDDVMVTVRPVITTANAGIDDKVCDNSVSQNNTYTLKGNAPQVFETGKWTIITQPVSSNASFNDDTKFNAAISGLIPGDYKLQWEIKNDVSGCASSKDEVLIKVFAQPVAGTVSGASQICKGSDVTLTLSGEVGKIMRWESSIDNFNTKTDINNTVGSLTVPALTLTTKYRAVVASMGGGDGCSTVVMSSPFTVKVDEPTVGGLLSGDNIVCANLGSGTINLTGHIGEVVRWEFSTNNGVNWSTVSSNTTTALSYSGLTNTTQYRAVVKNGTCNEALSSLATISVQPGITVANAGADVILCNATEYTLKGNTVTSGSGKWTEKNGKSITFDDVTKPNAKVSGLLPNEAYTFVWTITGGSSCPASIDEMILTNRPAITVANAGNDGKLCDQTVSNNKYTLQGNAIRSFETGKWTVFDQPVGSNAVFSDDSKYNTTVAGLIPGNYIFRWAIINDATENKCVTQFDEVTVRVFAQPVAGILTSPDRNVCISGNAGDITLSGRVGKVKAWMQSPDGVTWAVIPGETIDTYSYTNLNATTYYKVIVESEGAMEGCNFTVETQSIKITVDPATVAGTASGAKIICAGTNSDQVVLTGHTGKVIKWEASPNGTDQWTTVSSQNSTTYTYNNLTSTTYFRAQVQSGTCEILETNTVKITVDQAATDPNAGPDQRLCNASETTLSANVSTVGVGKWTQSGATRAVFENEANPFTKVSGLLPGETYQFKWTISNGTCPEKEDVVMVENLAPLINIINTTYPTICAGQVAELQGDLPTGGNNAYVYKWQASLDGMLWTDITAETGVDLSKVITATTYFRRIVNSGACSSISNLVQINVQPGIANNSISGSQIICTDDIPFKFVGQDAAGGDGNIDYQWSESTGSGWVDIVGAKSRDYQAPALTQTTSYRRSVASGFCAGPQSNMSNEITVTVNPDAKADFTVAKALGCIPFVIDATNLKVIEYPDRNSSYEWFADGVSIGIGPVFPGYTINSNGITVVIKLVVGSKFGCKSSEKSVEFKTVKTPVAKFTKSTDGGCGPLTVSFVNETDPLSGVKYIWDFGNGETSTSEQPIPVVFKPNPTHADTVYTIKLKVFTDCEVIEYTDYVKVRAVPRSVFSPDKTVGCAPFEVTSSNTSKGSSITYYWDFGDGVTEVTSDLNPVKHTYDVTKTTVFTMKMRAVNECGEEETAHEITVYPNTVTAELVVNGPEKDGCAPHIVKFSNNSKGANKFSWDFGDGSKIETTSSPELITHEFTRPGTYDVTLYATNGCSDRITVERIVVYPKPETLFGFVKSNYCVSDFAEMVNNSTGATSFKWDFGDGKTSNEAAPKHKYAQPGKYTVTLTAYMAHPSGDVCEGVLTQELEIFPLPKANFNHNGAALNCAPFNMVVSTTPANADSFTWDFGDPDSPDNVANGAAIAQHTFTKPGVYTVMLTAYTFAGCKETSTQIVTVSETPEADFTPEASFICGTSARLTFTNTTKYSGSGSISYKWFINDVLISTGKNLTNTFNTPSGGVKPYIFKVRMEASSPLGCVGKVTHDIQFNPFPQASFKENALLGCAPFNPFIENTSLYADSFEWYVNDVLVSTERNPTNIVVKDPESEITVKMIAKNQWDCLPSEITRKFKTRPMPTVGFIMDESVSCNGMLKVNFSNQSSGASGYSWDFGDGSAVSTVKDPVHVFVKAGIYEVKLSADNGFCTATSVQYVKVVDKPKAAFIADNRASCVSATVTFANQSINATKFIWDFGDGSFSGEKNPKHTYTSNKSAYNVKLTAIGEFGCQDEFTEIAYINVYPAPKADFEVKPDEVIKIPDYTFDFADKSEGEGLTYQWAFGDGKSSIEKDPKHTYTEVGTYSVRLIVKSSVGCLDTMVRNVTIEGVPGTLYVPNAFQPGSIRNELRSFMPKGVGLKEYRLRIFNTWGELIFETTRIEDGCPADGWDGSFNGKQLPQDVYIWDISAKFINGTEWEGMQYEKGAKKRTGTVHLIR
ncbi:hypothetical protein C3K47_10490 [Solitalea longa]|uniref:PKD domain-containing protein n=1 Tax=Solitalea longa TaxID=2079460 RepID=A0A2S5A2K7_9SPHI|nr:PKD domain-containing protein [Solitalea longa]POY36775.1 hypothetical protein C3K47_10490 [Solitalea longa]